MSQVPDWNTTSGAQGYQPAPGQVNPQAGMMPAGGMPVFPAVQIPPGMYYDQLSGLVLPQGTQLATAGRRIGSWFLAILLAIATLGIGYVIWGLIAWGKGQTPTQQVLGMQSWKPQTGTNATWGTMFLRELGYAVLGWIPFAQLVSFIMFLASKERRALHDHIAGTIVLHDPNKVLRPVAPSQGQLAA